MARPLTPSESAAVKNGFYDALWKRRGSVRGAAEELGVATSTLYRMVDMDEGLQEIITRVDREITDKTREVLTGVAWGEVKALPVQVTPSLFLLKAKGGWQDRITVACTDVTTFAPDHPFDAVVARGFGPPEFTLAQAVKRFTGAVAMRGRHMRAHHVEGREQQDRRRHRGQRMHGETSLR